MNDLPAPTRDQRLLHAALDVAPVGLVLIDVNGKVLKSNAAHRELWGLDQNAFRNLDMLPEFKGWWIDGPDRRGRPVQQDEWPACRALRGEGVAHEMIRIETFGSPPIQRTLLISATTLWNREGGIDGAAVSAVDISAQRQAEAIERDTAERLKFVLEAGRIGDWDLDLVTGTVSRSLSHDQCFGYPEGATACWTLETSFEHIHKDDRARVRRELDTSVERQQDLRVEFRVVWPDNSIHWLLSQARIYATEGQPTQLTGMVQDITSHKLANEQLLHSALHDPLTDLPNRAKLFESAASLLARNQRTNQPAAVFFLNLDRFKRINDTHGHAIGDELIRKVAQRLRTAVRAGDFIVRLGGDEFLILLREVDDKDSAADIAQLVIERIHDPYQIQGRVLSLSTSMGISMFPGDGTDIDTLTNNADLAMYRAKQAGHNHFHFYSPELAEDARLTRFIEQQLKSALTNEGFRLVYQPVFDLQSGRLISVEALLRWKDTEIGPEQFVPVAEATGIIGSISRWLLNEAAQQYVVWRKNGLPAVPIALNVSAVEFRNQNFVDHFQATLDAYNIGPEALQLELTETAVMDDIDDAIVQLGELQKRGVTILLDDFGTGQSNLTYLARLPLSKVKIDKSFITNLKDDSTNRTVTEAIVVLAHALGLSVVTEGIETQEVLEYVQALGCEQGQGFHLSRPLSGEALEAWHREYLKSPIAAEIAISGIGGQ